MTSQKPDRLLWTGGRFLILLFCLLATGRLMASEERVIAFAQDTMANDFRRAQVMDVAKALAAHTDIRFVHSDAKGQVSLMIRQIEQFIADRVDLLIVGTADENAVVPVVEKAFNSGIPVIILDRGVNTDSYTTFVNSDNVQIGRIAGEYIIEQLGGDGIVLLFEGLQQADVTQLRTSGFLESVAGHQGIRVIKRTGNYLRRDALIEMERLVSQGITVDAIFSESDSMLSGVREVLDRHKIDPGSILMVGVDYISEAQQAIRDGRQSASVLFPLGGRQAAELALSILAGEQVDKQFSIPVRLITRDLVDQVEPIF
jgi:ribose transport system substrate-binding protein